METIKAADQTPTPDVTIQLTHNRVLNQTVTFSYLLSGGMTERSGTIFGPQRSSFNFQNAFSNTEYTLTERYQRSSSFIQSVKSPVKEESSNFAVVDSIKVIR